MCTHLQNDVALVHAVEGLLGHKLEPFTLDEGEVLKGITKVRVCTCMDITRTSSIWPSHKGACMLAGIKHRLSIWRSTATQQQRT